jgi:hypothetical protein
VLYFYGTSKTKSRRLNKEKSGECIPRLRIEALIAGLGLASLEGKNFKVQVDGKFEAKEEAMTKYLRL